MAWFPSQAVTAISVSLEQQGLAYAVGKARMTHAVFHLIHSHPGHRARKETAQKKIEISFDAAQQDVMGQIIFR
jgi:hypothetical protein